MGCGGKTGVANLTSLSGFCPNGVVDKSHLREIALEVANHFKEQNVTPNMYGKTIHDCTKMELITNDIHRWYYLVVDGTSTKTFVVWFLSVTTAIDLKLLVSLVSDGIIDGTFVSGFYLVIDKLVSSVTNTDGFINDLHVVRNKHRRT